MKQLSSKILSFFEGFYRRPMFNLKPLFFMLLFLLIWMLLGLNPYYSRMIEVKIQSNRDYIAQVFWLNDPSNNFSESNSLSIKIEKDVQVKSYIFNIPSTTFLDSIRFDPLNKLGNLKITEMNLIIKTVFGQTQVNPIDFSSIYDTKNIRTVLKNNQLEIISKSDDPMLFFKIHNNFVSQPSFKMLITNFFKNSNSEHKFYFLFLIGIFAITYNFSILLDRRFVITFVILIFSILISFLTCRVIDRSSFSIQPVEKAIGHMNYFGLSKLKDQLFLFSYIFLIPFVFIVFVRYMKKRVN